MPFHFNSWLVYFYFYCICGWGFESTYVSLANKKWINRGFMKGPWLPLYGSGAVVILLVTLPFQQYPIAVYFAGAITATILEYFTGVVMLKLFKVRYWDYSYRKIQFQGHICLVSTIAWGFLSLLMVYVVHKPVARLVNSWNVEVVSVFTFIITICMVYDFTNAFREAMDLRSLIIQAEELKKRLEEVLAEQRDKLSESIIETKGQLGQRVEETREQMNEKKEALSQAVRESKQQLVQAVEESRNQFGEYREEAQTRRREQRMVTIAEIEAARERLRQNMEKHSKQLLLHNPGSGFKGLEEETAEIKRRLQARRRK